MSQGNGDFSRTRNKLYTTLLVLCAFLPSLVAGCSVRHKVLYAFADELSSATGGSFTTDEDLELVGDAVPFALKLMESIHQQAPDHVGLNLALASGFTQYAVVFVQFPAERQKYDDFTAYRAGLERARRLLLRARSYALQGISLQHPGFTRSIMEDPDAALRDMSPEDVPGLYWLGASWLAAISNSKEQPELIGQLPLAAAVLRRALELREDWDRGAIHELLILLEPSLPLPGGLDRAQEHFDRALELSEGQRASTFVALATATCIDTQDRERFVSLLNRALDVDPGASPDDLLANEYAQRQARFLLDHVDDLFLEEVP